MLELLPDSFDGWILRQFVPRRPTLVGLVTATTALPDGTLALSIDHTLQIQPESPGAPAARERWTSTLSRADLRTRDGNEVWVSESTPYERFLVTLSRPPASTARAAYPWRLWLWLDALHDADARWKCPVPGDRGVDLSLAGDEPRRVSSELADVDARVVAAGLALAARGAELGTLRVGDSMTHGAWRLTAAVDPWLGGTPDALLQVRFRSTTLGVSIEPPRREIDADR